MKESIHFNSIHFNDHTARLLEFDSGTVCNSEVPSTSLRRQELHSHNHIRNCITHIAQQSHTNCRGGNRWLRSQGVQGPYCSGEILDGSDLLRLLEGNG